MEKKKKPKQKNSNELFSTTTAEAAEYMMILWGCAVTL